jgi:hypothetical protein
MASLATTTSHAMHDDEDYRDHVAITPANDHSARRNRMRSKDMEYKVDSPPSFHI